MKTTKKTEKKNKKTPKIVKKETKKKIVKKKDSAEELLREIKVSVIGIGGGGGSIISEISINLSKVFFAAINTDKHALDEVAKNRKVKSVAFGKQHTGGLGTGMDPKLGRKAAEDDIEDVKLLFKDQDIVIFVSSLGGGTGSGALPVFTRAAREMGALVYGVFTLPFSFEGDKKMKIAKDAIKEANKDLNAITILPNEKIFEVVDKNTPLKKALTVMNQSLAESLEGLIETIYETGLINIDFADVRAVLENRRGPRKLTYFTTVEGDLDDGAEEIVKRAISNPLYPYEINKARGILFNITGGKDIGLTDISSISESVAKHTEDDAKIIVGIMQKNKFKDRVKIALLATGCESDFMKKELEDEEDAKPKIVVKKKEKVRTEKKIEKNEVKKEEPKKEAVEKITVVPSLEKNYFSQEEKVKKPENQEEKDLLEEEEKWDKPSFLRR